ncbi:MAG: alpha-amylase [Sediminicola sp.]|jgi:glycosidase|tara:strand:- start:1612 stop:3048 length:1437 start_codon:yes stop_codon:yes gene_type:complete
MKRVTIALFSLVVLVACKNKIKNMDIIEKPPVVTIPDISDDILERAVIYEANIRQYSTEGTFEEFTKDIPELKKIGVKIIWLMPVFPISKTKRKATGGDFARLIEDEAERERMLGSYYAVSDFTKINPEFGSIEDFRRLISTAHENGIYVILDWVPNHTGWDHTWISEHPDYYTKNSNGEITDPLNHEGEPVGWADVADLNYGNEAMQEEMIHDMKHWITKENIDGFRCDMAGMVPLEFWKKAIPQLRAEKNIFMLAEAWEPALLKDNLFEMAYAWEGHHLMNAIAKGEKNVHDFDGYIRKMSNDYQESDILMNFITNHDENSWNGTVGERLGDASGAIQALSFTMPGMPLIYSGQEYDMDHRLKFFEKDCIPKKKGKMWPLLEKLGYLKNSYPALKGGKNAAKYERIETSDNASILAFQRVNEDSKFIYLANLSNEVLDFSFPITGEFKNALTDETISLKPDSRHVFLPWEYLLLIK